MTSKLALEQSARRNLINRRLGAQDAAEISLRESVEKVLSEENRFSSY